MQLPDAAIGSIVAAAIAGMVVFISTVLSKEQKTSEFRQVWIDELRKDIAQYISGASEIAAFYKLKKDEIPNQMKFLEDNFKLIQELQSVEHRIILRLNPKEHGNLIAKVKSFRKNIIAIHNKGQGDGELEAILTDALLADAKDLLKNEWERVKRGEPAFRLVKWIGVIVGSVLGIFSLFFLLVNPSSHSIKDQSSTDALQTDLKTLSASAPNGVSQFVQVTIGKPDSQVKTDPKKVIGSSKKSYACPPKNAQPKKADDCQIRINGDSELP